MKFIAVFQCIALFAFANAKLNERDLVQNNEIKDIIAKNVKSGAQSKGRRYLQSACVESCGNDNAEALAAAAGGDQCKAAKLAFTLGLECVVRCTKEAGITCDDQTTFCSATAACKVVPPEVLEGPTVIPGCTAISCDEVAGDVSAIFGGCLAGDMVALTTNGEKMVKDLKVGDVVSVGNGEFEPIVWSTEHRDTKGQRGNKHVTATFVGFQLENGQKVHLTANHFAQTTEGLILAGQVTVGQTFITNAGESTTVVAIDREVKKGAFNPQTPSQKIVVNGIVASTRTEHSPQFMGTVFKVLAFLQSMTPSFVYNGLVEAVCQYVFEPLLFGEVSPSLYFSGAAAVVVAGVLRKKVAV